MVVKCASFELSSLLSYPAAGAWPPRYSQLLVDLCGSFQKLLGVCKQIEIYSFILARLYTKELLLYKLACCFFGSLSVLEVSFFPSFHSFSQPPTSQFDESI